MQRPENCLDPCITLKATKVTPKCAKRPRGRNCCSQNIKIKTTTAKKSHNPQTVTPYSKKLISRITKKKSFILQKVRSSFCSEVEGPSCYKRLISQSSAQPWLGSATAGGGGGPGVWWLIGHRRCHHRRRRRQRWCTPATRTVRRVALGRRPAQPPRSPGTGTCVPELWARRSCGSRRRCTRT